MKKPIWDYTIVDVAKQFAEEKHNGMEDDSGQPYTYHLQQVVHILEQVTDDPDIIAAAWLHDTIEDTDTTHGELVHAFGDEIAALVLEVTHEGNDTNGHYFPRLKSRKAILIKFADRLSNLSRMEPWSDKRREHYLKKSKFWKDQP